jgi:hypothetical protein
MQRVARWVRNVSMLDGDATSADIIAHYASICADIRNHESEV